MDLKKEMIELISPIIQVPEDEIDVDASFMDVYGMDSLRILEILAEVENKYQITIDPEMLSQITSVSAIMRITQEYLDKKNE